LCLMELLLLLLLFFQLLWTVLDYA